MTLPLFDFTYKTQSESEERVVTTGDTKTRYTGIKAEDAPWAMHHNGRILNPVNTFGHMMLGLQALAAKVEALEASQDDD